MTLDGTQATVDLFRDHGDAIYRYFRVVTGDGGLAEEMTQEVFLRLLAGWGRFRKEASLRTWLWSIARNVLHEERRRRRANPDPPDVPAPARDPALLMDLKDVLGRLPPAEKMVAALCLVEDLSPAEAAGRLGWSSGRVRVLLHRARRRLQELLLDPAGTEVRHHA